MPDGHPNAHARGLRNRRVSARMALSQNFLINHDVARRIVRSAELGPDDLVLEVGAGDGMLTRQLLPLARSVRAYEIDGYYARRLRERFRKEPRLSVRHQDFRLADAPTKPFAVVANVPYSVSTDVLRWCLAADALTSATLLTQREFARKHTGDYGRWSKITVTYWPWVTTRLGCTVGRRNFDPVPRVDSAVLHLHRRTEPLVPLDQARDYAALVELGFSGVGGSLAASLRRLRPARQVTRACSHAGVGVDLPVGFVTPTQWLALHRALRE